MRRKDRSFQRLHFLGQQFSNRSHDHSCLFAFASARGTIASSSSLPCSFGSALLPDSPPPAPQEGEESSPLPTREAAGSATAAGSPTLESTSSPPAPQPEADSSAAAPAAPARDAPPRRLCHLQPAQLPSGMRAMALKIFSPPGRPRLPRPMLFPSGCPGTRTALSINSLSLSGGVPSQQGAGPTVL
uniref:uncharacterized protein LOC129132396 n=1 Tax=Agelaius phoeniceus TaxID=39638 RepID=UPI0023EC3A08|nr:uncharacterized protein LOC129132396 [Agelaius phoeniceus]